MKKGRRTMRVKCNIKSNLNNCMDRAWKEKNKLYLKELEIFFDRVDNIEDCELKQSVINQMLICDKVLTEIAEDMFNNFYLQGYENAKHG